ncbi:MAG: translation initiation factor IF-3 [bacterium]
MTKNRGTPVNEMILANEVLVIGSEGEQLGVMSKKDALDSAYDSGLDLVEVASNANPPVCRIMDYGRFKYQQSKKAQIAKKKQKVIQIKEIKIRPKTDMHDLEVKARNARRFLSEGNKIKVTVRFRGREIVHPERGQIVMERFLELLEGECVIEQQAKMEGRNMILVLAPST